MFPFFLADLNSLTACFQEGEPDLSKAETYATNAPKSNYQIHPIDNEYNMPHICYHDWAKGKHNGSAGHIFWEE